MRQFLILFTKYFEGNKFFSIWKTEEMIMLYDRFLLTQICECVFARTSIEKISYSKNICIQNMLLQRKKLYRVNLFSILQFTLDALSLWIHNCNCNNIHPSSMLFQVCFVFDLQCMMEREHSDEEEIRTFYSAKK